MATSAEKAAQRNVIEYCFQLKMTPTQTFKQLQTTEKYKNMSRALVFKWHKRFAEGWTGESDSKLGRPTEINSQIVNHVRDVIDTDRRLTVREISEDIGISKTFVHRILRETLGMSRVCARWVPRLLTEDDKEKRVQLSKSSCGDMLEILTFLTKSSPWMKPGSTTTIQRASSSQVNGNILIRHPLRKPKW